MYDPDKHRWLTGIEAVIDKDLASELRAHPFPAGSMGPKVAAAIQFVERTGKRAAIGSLEDIEQIVAGTAGTNVVATR